MKNLKKTLAVVLAFVMVLSMGAISTFAYSDITEGTLTDEAVSILSSLDIITGFEDGTFRPEDTVTRAQMAAIICRMLDYESQAESSKGFTVFNDVAADHWASGYVNVAQAQGIINGYGNGNFGPEDKVTYEQAVKMIVSALGYDLAANSKGGYPTGYLAIASAEGITKNANGRVGDAAARATIAILVYNSLEVQLMDQTEWSTGTDGDKYTKKADTVLSHYLGVDKVEAVVEATPLTLAVAANTYKKDAVPYVQLNGERFYWNGGSTGEYVSSAYAHNFDNLDASLVDTNALLGKKVVAYVDSELDNQTGRRMVRAIAEKQGANNVTVVNANQLQADANAGKIVYKKDGARKNTDAKLDTTPTTGGTTVYKNFGTTFVTVGGLDETSATNDFIAEFSNGGVLELISNDNDTLIDYIVITAYNNEAVIEKVTDDEGIMIYEPYGAGYLNEVDTEEEDELVVVYKDGALADISAVEENNTVSEISLIGGDIRVFYVSSKTVTGEVVSYSLDDDNVTIAGENYDVSAGFVGLGTVDNAILSLAGEEGTFFLNVDGQIAWNETDPTVAGNYGYVLAVDYTGGISDAYSAQVVTTDGTVALYDISTKAKYVNTSDVEVATKGWEVAGILANKIAGASYTQGTTTEPQTQALFATAAAKLTKANGDNAMFKVRIKDGKITRVEEIASAGSIATKKYDAETMTYQGFELNDEIVVFSIDDALASGAVVTADDITIGKISTFFEDGEGYTFTAFDTEDQIPGVIVGYDLVAKINQGSDAVIISGVRSVKYDDDTAIAITGIQGGKEVTYTLYDDETGVPAGANTLAKGDVILVANATAEGVTDSFQKIHDAAKTKDTAIVTEVTAPATAVADEIANGYGKLVTTETTNKVFVIDQAIDTTISGSTYTFSAAPTVVDGVTVYSPIAMIAGANYTLVDFTESTSDPEISRKAPGTALFSKSASYQSEVFVRVYDGVIVDVVVYRYKLPQA